MAAKPSLVKPVVEDGMGFLARQGEASEERFSVMVVVLTKLPDQES